MDSVSRYILEFESFFADELMESQNGSLNEITSYESTHHKTAKWSRGNDYLCQTEDIIGRQAQSNCTRFHIVGGKSMVVSKALKSYCDAPQGVMV